MYNFPNMKNKIRLTIIVSIFAVTLLTCVSFAEQFEMNFMPPSLTKGIGKEKSSGEKLWTNSINTIKIINAGKTMLYTEEKGQGIWGNDKKEVSWISTGFFNLDGKDLSPNQIKVIYKDKEGKTVRTLEKFYDSETKKVMVRDNGKTKYFDYKNDIVDKEGLRLALPNYPFESGKKSMEFYLLTHEPTLYKFTAKFLGKDQVKLGSGIVNCFKLELIPDLGAANIFGAFIPKTYFWVNENAPHEFIKYEGLESGLGTPYISIESDK